MQNQHTRSLWNTCPKVAVIRGDIVDIDNRDNNTNVRFHQQNTLLESFQTYTLMSTFSLHFHLLIIHFNNSLKQFLISGFDLLDVSATKLCN